jgi:NAD-dependent deacetylase
LADVYDEAARILLDHPPFLVLTGAGISVESGLPPFRGTGGIWTRYDPEDYGHIRTFRNEPERAWVLLSELIKGSLTAKPNQAHIALTRLQERKLAGAIITQNVDGLHRLAGSRDILDVHGDARKILCPSCGKREELIEVLDGKPDPLCECGAYRRPDIVFYGESLPEEKIERAWNLAMSGMDLLVIGTSGIVFPVAHIPYLVKVSGGRLVVIDPHDVGLSPDVIEVHIREKAVFGMLELEKRLIRST